MSIRLRLFGDVTDSPGATTTDIESILTPESKGDNSVLGNDTPSFFYTSSKLTFETKSDARRNLFAVKRLTEDDFPNDTSCSKKNVISAVERLESRVLVADGSRDYILPTVKGKHGDLRSISPETLAEILKGKYMDEVGKVTIVDCRYPYEFDGGHIRGAINLYTKDDVNSLLYSCDHQSIKPHILIFHCEFSSERGPKMCRFLRSQDRELNKEHYPKLKYPEIYLLNGGYKAFFTSHKHCCEPSGYKPMLHEDHADDLRHFRVKSKSWTEGEQKTSKRQRSRLNRHLSF